MDDVAGPILLVEDDSAMRDAVRELLEGEGYAVRCAANGRHALDLLADSEPPSLILLDLMMPIMDGWQFLSERRRVGDSATRSVPVVLLSGLGFIRGAVGVADFLRKPIDAEALLGCVRRFARTSATGLGIDRETVGTGGLASGEDRDEVAEGDSWLHGMRRDPYGAPEPSSERFDLEGDRLGWKTGADLDPRDAGLKYRNRSPDRKRTESEEEP